MIDLSRELFIVIPVHNRRDMLRELLDELNYDPNHIILVDNNSEPPLNQDFSDQGIIVWETERNIQHLWNVGWRSVEVRATGPYAIAFLNSDAWVSLDTLRVMVGCLDSLDASVVSPDSCSILMPGGFIRKTTPGPVPWQHLMAGYGFVVRGELQTRFDERFVWWYGDNDFDWQARREFGGTVLVSGVQIGNRDADGAQRDYPELCEQTNRDRIAFINKWGVDTSG